MKDPKLIIHDSGHIKAAIMESLSRLIGTNYLPQQGEMAAIIVEAYTENHRDYHDICHPADMLRMFGRMYNNSDEIKHSVNLDLMVWLIVFHDIVVKLGREKGWNERRSAELALIYFKLLGIGEPYVSMVPLGIECTIDHKLPEGYAWTDQVHRNTIELFLDLDLAGLGQDPEGFAADTEAVWREFRAVAKREEYDAGRAAWAKSFLGRDRVYHTKYFANREAQARANLEALAQSA